jgi:hypothetical protein
MAAGSSGEHRSTARALRIFTVFLITGTCGWFVMEMEILGARVLAPYFGSAIYVVMGSVIGVFLLSLACGYLLGGWFSRRPGSQWLLGLGLVLAGAWLCCLPFFMDPLCEALLALEIGVHWGSLLAAFALFSVPTALLGSVSPTAVRWLTRQAGDAGLNAGLVLAFSTVASFAGCLVTAFYLVRLSVQRTIVISGTVLLALGGFLLLHALLTGASLGRANDAEGGAE